MVLQPCQQFVRNIELRSISSDIFCRDRKILPLQKNKQTKNIQLFLRFKKHHFLGMWNPDWIKSGNDLCMTDARNMHKCSIICINLEIYN